MSWHRFQLAEVAEVVRGVTYKKEQARSEEEPNTVPLLRATNIGDALDLSGGLVYVPESVVKASQYLQRGDIVLASSSGSLSVVGKSAIVRQSWLGTFGAFCAVIRSSPRIDARFLALYLRSPDVRSRWSEAARGTNINNLKRGDLAQTPVPLPPLNEQHRIVDLLEDHLSRLDAADNELRRSLTKLRKLREAGLQSAITGAMPGSPTRTIGELGTVTSGLTPLRTNRRFHEGGTIPWITSGDLHQGRVLTARNWVTEHALRETSLKIVPAGAILVAMYGEGRTRGTAALLGIDATTNQACAAIQLHDSRLTSWVKIVLDSNYEAMRRLAAGGVQPNLNLSLVRAIRVPVPSAAYREAALDRLDELSAPEKQLRSALTTGQARSSALRHSLLAAAFSGRLTRGTSDLSGAEEMIGA